MDAGRRSGRLLRAGARPPRSWASIMRRAVSRFPASAPRRSRPRRPARGPAAGVSGKCARTMSRSCSTATTVRASPCQRRTRARRSAVVLASIAVNGSSSRMTPASWRSSRANSARCICPPESVPMGARSKPVRPTAAMRVLDRRRGPRGRCRRTGRRGATGPWRRGRRRRSGSCGRCSAACGR